MYILGHILILFYLYLVVEIFKKYIPLKTVDTIYKIRCICRGDTFQVSCTQGH